ncbi:MAG: glycosyltransferase [Pseudolysinimonas sp.]
MSPSVLFVDTYYFDLLRDHGLERHPAANDTYDAALDAAIDIGFGTGGALTRDFRAMGWAADIVVPNSLTLQTLWAREHGRRSPWSAGWRYGPHLARLPLARNALHRLPHLHGILLEQVRRLKPDVVYVQDINLMPPAMTRELKKHTRLLVGEIASPLPPKPFLLAYDLIVSALPTIVETARSWGLQSEWVPLGFDERWASDTPASEREIDAIFVGSFSRLQPATTPLLQAVARAVPGLRIYGPADRDALEAAGLASHHHGPAWGRDMFELLQRSKLVVNRHGSIAGKYAVNMRMYETTGTGAALVTERKSNLGELFELDTEVIPYDDVDDAAAKAAALLADPKRLDRVASAGHARTVRDHTYAQRAQQLAQIFAQRF